MAWTYRGLHASIAIGFLSATLSSVMLPLAIYYVSGLYSFMVPKLALHVLYGFYGIYLYSQVIVLGILAGLLHYSFRIRRQLRVGVGKAVKVGFAGALYSAVISLFSICCAPLTVSMLGVLGSGPMFFLLLHSERLTVLGLTVEAIAILLALRSLRRAGQCSLGEPPASVAHLTQEVYHLKGDPGVKLYREAPGPNIFYTREGPYRIYGKVDPSNLVRETPRRATKIFGARSIILGLVLANILAVAFVAASPEFEEGVRSADTGALEVHVLANGQFVREGVVVKVEGPAVKISSLSNYIARFEGLPLGDYIVSTEKGGRYSVQVRLGEEVHIFLRLP
jgi:hypothetical protein